MSEKKQKSKVREYAETLIIALLIALFVRAFVVQAFKIPSESMKPTLLISSSSEKNLPILVVLLRKVHSVEAERNGTAFFPFQGGG